MTAAILEFDAARCDGEHLPQAPLSLTFAAGDFAMIETPGSRWGTAFAALSAGLAPLVSGRVRFLGRDWASMPVDHANALRGHIGRLFYAPLRDDTPDVGERVILKQLHHTRLPREAVLAEAALLARRFGLPGLPSGPAWSLSELDLLRAACVRAFLGKPQLVVLELAPAAQADSLLQALLAVGADARGDGACVLWLVAPGHRLRSAAIRPTHRLRLSDAGLAAITRPMIGAA